MGDPFDDIDHQLTLCTDLNRIIALKSHRNSLAPVSKLPHDLLSDIFIIFHRSESDSKNWRSIFNRRSPACLPLTHVSRTWRNAALRCPLLWTNIIFVPAKWTAIMLERSQTAPLTVEIPITDTNLKDNAFKNSLRLTLSHIYRIRYLFITPVESYRKMDPDGVLFLLLSGSFDILEGLNLSGSPFTTDYTYPSMKKAPCLRSLELHHFCINWQKFPSIGNLTSLVLEVPPRECQLTMDNILSIFRTMSRLERLILIYAIPALPRNTTILPPLTVAAPVKLEYLSYFSLTGVALDCANFMRHLDIPHCRQFKLKAEPFESKQDLALAVPLLANITSTIFRQLEKQELPYLASINGVGGGDHYTYGVAFTVRPAVHTEEAHLELHFVWPPPRQLADVETFFRFGDLLLGLPLDRMVYFSASTHPEEFLKYEEWLEIFLRLSHVETVLLSGGKTYRVLNAFHDAHWTSGADVIVLPRLTTLEIRNVHFSFPFGDDELFSTLKRALTRRVELGWPSVKIILVDCHVTSKQLAALDTLTSEPIDYIGEPKTDILDGLCSYRRRISG
ncbi:hypothetical protein BGW80DRAFT_1287494 [Lactifluus volemus]|nr:hypothetical protein BGW80DRAFT_1287494 [Lactifluus volemus]